MLVEYKPFEPAFYATDIADWGMASCCRRRPGRAPRCWSTPGTTTTQNIEQIVAWLLDEDMLGGFHFNDRKYADDDLTLGSIDPYQVFRIFHEIHSFAADRGAAPKIAYMIDQSHNEKPKIEATIQTVMMAQELYAKAALVDHDALRRAQAPQGSRDQRRRKLRLSPRIGRIRPIRLLNAAPALTRARRAARRRVGGCRSQCVRAWRD
jgi:L-rhamnose isomerase/sugar isomerase